MIFSLLPVILSALGLPFISRERNKEERRFLCGEREKRRGTLRVAGKGWLHWKHGKSRIMLMGTSDSVSLRYFKIPLKVFVNYLSCPLWSDVRRNAQVMGGLRCQVGFYLPLNAV